jgi:hypothetical protein
MALTTTTEAESAARKKRKGKNFCAEEERQLCRSFLAVSQDPIPGNGRRTPAFWDRIHEHYTKNKPENAGERPARSLESKWGIIKHEVEKFDGCYGAVLALNEAGTSVEDVLRRALELYKLKHPKGLSFSFIHCWLLLKDIPKWAETSLTDEKKTTTTTTTPVATTTTPTTMVKRKPTDMLLPRWADTSNEAKKTTPPVTTTTMKRKPTASSMVEGSEDCEVVESLSDSGESSPSGRKAVEWRRKNKKTQKLKESTMRAQAKATADMAAATLMKAEILQDQSALALFTMPDDQLTSAEAREYLQLRRQEELLKLRRRLAESNNNKSIITTIAATTPAAAVVATSTPAATNTMTTTTNIDTTTTTITTTPQQPNSGMSTNPTAT